MYHLHQCCRACLKIECTLTHTSATDGDNIRFIDKLAACISDVVRIFYFFFLRNALHFMLLLKNLLGLAKRRLSTVYMFCLH